MGTGSSVVNWLNYLVIEVNVFMRLQLGKIKFYMEKLNHLKIKAIVL